MIPLTLQRWERLTFLHWRYPPHLLAERLPAGRTLDLYDRSAWIGMTPFLLSAGSERYNLLVPTYRRQGTTDETG